MTPISYPQRVRRSMIQSTRAASSPKSSPRWTRVVPQWASQPAAGKEGVEEVLGRFACVVAVAIFELFGENPILEPVEQLAAVGAQDADLGEVDMPVDEARHDDAALDVCHLETGVSLDDVAVGAEVADLAVLDDQQAVGMEARRFLLLADVLPGIVDEVEEGTADADGAHDRVVSCCEESVPARGRATTSNSKVKSPRPA